MIRAENNFSNTPSAPDNTARVLVFGNEKGGCGKSTVAMHTAIGLLRLGFKVGSIDIDSRQASFSKYLKNRFHYGAQVSLENPLPMPSHITVPRSEKPNSTDARMEEGFLFTEALNELMRKNDFVVIDTPGSDTYMSRLAHSFADTIITPMNDSFIDMDLLAEIDPETFTPLKPNIYSEMVWEQRKHKVARGHGGLEWIVMRNRVAKDINKVDYRVEKVLNELSKRYAFKVCEGFTERGIFRELFLSGLTLLDLHEIKDTKMTLDMVQARQEIRNLLQTIGLRKKTVSRKVSSEQALETMTQKVTA